MVKKAKKAVRKVTRRKVFKETLRPLTKGGIIVYKRAYAKPHMTGGYVIITLEIPRSAKRNMAFNAEGRVPRGAIDHEGRKCRASAAIVRRIEKQRSGKRLEVAYASYAVWSEPEPRWYMKYEKGKRVKPSMPFDTSDATCASGIHFFLHRRVAETYNI